jgi:hypothetical protein
MEKSCDHVWGLPSISSGKTGHICRKCRIWKEINYMEKNMRMKPVSEWPNPSDPDKLFTIEIPFV